MKYIVTKEIKSETQIFRNFYMQDFVFGMVWIVLVLTLRQNVHSTLQIPYVVFYVVVGIRLMLPSRTNPKRRYYQSIALYLSRPKELYAFYKEENQSHEGERDQAHPGRDSRYGIR